jgi:type IV pilus assembly protein PilF
MIRRTTLRPGTRLLSTRLLRKASFVLLTASALVTGGCAGNRTPSPPPNPTPAPSFRDKPDAKQRGEAAGFNLQMAIDYFQQGNLAQAKEKLDRSLDQNPRNANAHAFAGLLYERLGEEREAESHFTKAMSLEGKNPDIQNNYAVFLCRKGKTEEGRKLALQAAANPLYKTPDSAYVNAGFCAQAAGKQDLAEADFRKALAVRPRSLDALMQMANLEFERGDYMPARAFMERAFQVEPPNAAALWLALRIERALGATDGVATYERRLRSEFPTSAEAQHLFSPGRAP